MELNAKVSLQLARHLMSETENFTTYLFKVVLIQLTVLNQQKIDILRGLSKNQKYA